MANTARLDTTRTTVRTHGAAADTALLIGRLALVVIFVMSGFGKLAGLEGTAGYIGSKGLPAPMVLAVLAGLGELVLGALIAVGFKTRLAALGLIMFTALATYFFHAFWTQPPAQQMADQIHAMKNLGLIGGLIILAGVGAGRFSVDRH
jgi:putative oxidoreductase